MIRRLVEVLLLLCFAQATTIALAGDTIDDDLSIIAKTGPQGAGSAEARAACDRLASRGCEILVRLLGAMETDNAVAANWYRSVYETIVERELAVTDAHIPLGAVKDFVRDARHGGRARRLALALCDRVEPRFSKSLIPGLLDDPEFRNDAVEAALAAGQQALESGDSETARDRFGQAFEHSRDSAQTVRAADKLAGLGEKAEIAAHLGLVVDWWLVGPFDAPGFSGFAAEFPPERRVDLQAKYAGQEGREIAWVRHHAADPLGLVNLVQALAPVREAVGYAYAELSSPREQAAELRCGADDNCSVWLNGEKVFAREQWLNGIRFDRFVSPVRLREGTNRLLVKVCQGPANKDPQVANNWSLQLRLCDPQGRGVPFREALSESVEGDKK